MDTQSFYGNEAEMFVVITYDVNTEDTLGKNGSGWLPNIAKSMVKECNALYLNVK